MEPTAKISSPPPGIAAPLTEIRQQSLMDALVGSSSRPPHHSFVEAMSPTPIGPPTHLQHPPFMHQASNSTSLLNTNLPSSPINDHKSPPPSFIGSVFSSRPLESTSSSTRRSLAPISPIGPPVNTRRPSSVPIQEDPLIAASNMIKRPSITSPFDTNTTEPRSFFSSFLFGDPRSDDVRSQQQNWNHGWTATSVLTENVHGKLFGDALVRKI